MAARTFEDSAGVVWEVFEVHRASQAARGVSAGFEKGWLAFASIVGKRRLAPFPAEWESAPPLELERLCEAARHTTPARYPIGAPAPMKASSVSAPRVVRVPGEPLGDAEADEARPSLVRDAVRAFAHDARSNNLPAIEAMVRLKVLLAERYAGADVAPETRADATDMRRIRRWFVQAFYFERPA